MFQLNNQEVSQLRSQIAIDASIFLVRTFMKMRTILAEHTDLKKRLHEVERRLSQGFSQHEQELQKIRFMIARLKKPVKTKKRRLGF